MPLHILVTGGAGFIGSHLVDALLAAGHRVRVFDNLEPQVHGPLREQGLWPEYCNPAAEYVLGDMRDRAALAAALQDIEVIFHQAAMVGVGQSMYQVERYLDVNTRGTAVLLDILANDAALRRRVQKLIAASSMSIYGEGQYTCPTHGAIAPRPRTEAQLAARDWEMRCPLCRAIAQPAPTGEDKPPYSTSIYAVSKRDQEESVLAIGQAYGLPAVALRYFNVYGARQALSNPYTGVAAIFSSRLLNGKPPVIFEDGCQARDFTHVSDIVQANLLAMDCPEMVGGAYNVGTGRPVTVLDVAWTLAEHLRSAVQPEVVYQYRAGDIRHCYADISRIQALGYRPHVRFEDGVAELVSWVREQSAHDGYDQARAELLRRGLAV